MEVKFFDGLRGGDSQAGVKLCLGITGGDFWSRVQGCQNLYRGESIHGIDFENPLAVSEPDETLITVPSLIEHQAGLVYFYALRRANQCGDEERNLSAVLRVAFDEEAEFLGPCCNTIFDVAVKQVAGPKVKLSWYYTSMGQFDKPVRFKVYSDAASGVIDYLTPAGVIEYAGQGFYVFESETLSEGRYLYCIRTESKSGRELSNGSVIEAEVTIETPNGVKL
jgi:hypothetical protein